MPAHAWAPYYTIWQLTALSLRLLFLVDTRDDGIRSFFEEKSFGP